MIKVKNKDLFKKCLVLVMALMLIGTTIFTQFASAEEMGEWKEIAPLEDGVSQVFSTQVINGQIYTFGGAGATLYNSVSAYNPITDTWTKKAPLPSARSELKTAVIDGKVYAMGGYTNSLDYCSDLFVYDIATDKWEKKRSMPRVRKNFEVEVIDGKIYAFGGHSVDNNRCKIVEEYDPITDKWTVKSSMENGVEKFSSEVIDGKIYVIGGTFYSSFKKAQVYDPKTNKWTFTSSMNANRYSLRTVLIDGKIYAIGGPLNYNIEIYNPLTDTWKIESMMPDEMENFEVQVIDKKIYIIGGYKIGKNSLEKLDSVIIYDTVEKTWKSSHMNFGRHRFKSEVIDGKIYVFGGVGKGNKPLFSAEVYDPNGGVNPTLTVTPSADKVKVGQEFTTTIGIHNVKNIFAEDIKINYDKERFEYVSAQPKEGVKICNEDKTEEGKLRFVIASLGKGNEATGDKDLIELKFKAKKPGEGKVDIIKGRIADNETLEIDVADENCGEAIITVEVSADVNRDGSTTLLDLGIDAGYYNMKASDTDTSKHDADVVPNGTIDDEDLIEITGDLLKNKDYVLNNA